MCVFLIVGLKQNSMLFRHPARVCMTYFEHARFSLGLSWTLGWACLGSVVHAIIPDLLVTHTSDALDEMQQRIRKAGCR